MSDERTATEAVGLRVRVLDGQNQGLVGTIRLDTHGHLRFDSGGSGYLIDPTARVRLEPLDATPAEQAGE